MAVVLISLTAVFIFLRGFPSGFKNGRLLIYSTRLCPSGLNWPPQRRCHFVNYFGIKNKEECLKIGGYPIIDFGYFQGFNGCSPDGKFDESGPVQ